MTSYLKHQRHINNNLIGGSGREIIPWGANNRNLIGDKVIILDAKSVLFGSSSKWDTRDTPHNAPSNWGQPGTAGEVNTPLEILYNICAENSDSMVYVLSNYYNVKHFEKFNEMITNNPQYFGQNIQADGIKNLEIVPYNGADKKSKMEQILRKPQVIQLLNQQNSKLIYLTRNYHGGNSTESIIKNTEKQESIIQTIIKDLGIRTTVQASTAHIPSDIFYKHYLKSPSQLMYKSGQDMVQTYSNASPSDIAYGPFMKSPQAYKRDNQWMWPPAFNNNPDPIIETGDSLSTYKTLTQGQVYNNLGNNVNSIN